MTELPTQARFPDLLATGEIYFIYSQEKCFPGFPCVAEGTGARIRAQIPLALFCLDHTFRGMAPPREVICVILPGFLALWLSVGAPWLRASMAPSILQEFNEY